MPPRWPPRPMLSDEATRVSACPRPTSTSPKRTATPRQRGCATTRARRSHREMRQLPSPHRTCRAYGPSLPFDPTSVESWRRLPAFVVLRRAPVVWWRGPGSLPASFGAPWAPPGVARSAPWMPPTAPGMTVGCSNRRQIAPTGGPSRPATPLIEPASARYMPPAMRPVGLSNLYPGARRKWQYSRPTRSRACPSDSREPQSGAVASHGGKHVGKGIAPRASSEGFEAQYFVVRQP
jgi:hypothetical protein